MRNIKPQSFFFCLLLTAGLLLCCSCKEEHTVPDTEKLDLVVRFFDSIEKGRPEVAIRQGKKLHILCPNEDYLPYLISIQQTNHIVEEAQKLVREDKLDEALALIQKAYADYPQNPMLLSLQTRLSQLRNAKKLLRAMQKAKNSSSMRGARIAARAGLSLNMTPELEKFLADYELKEAAVAAKEKANTIAAERVAQEAALKSKQEADKWQKREEKFQTESAKKTAEGERVRQAAGPVPDPPALPENAAPAEK